MKNNVNQMLNKVTEVVSKDSTSPFKTAFKITLGFYLAQVFISAVAILGFMIVATIMYVLIH